MVQVSVIIPTHNRPEKTMLAAASVLGQTFTDRELIVVDDGSTDQTVGALASVQGDLRVIRQPRLGVSAARNRGLAEARGDLIAFLDSDDTWEPEKLEVQVDFMNRRPDILICQTGEVWIRNGRRVNPRKHHQKPSGDIFLPSLKLCLVSPSAVMMRRRFFDSVGLFDESLPACEDYDLWLRGSCRYPVPLIDQPLVVKTGGHADQLSRTVVGLDQYRVRALEKILTSGLLTPIQEQAAREELVTKATIFGQGCLKRGRLDLGRDFLALAGRYSAEGKG